MLKNGATPEDAMAYRAEHGDEDTDNFDSKYGHLDDGDSDDGGAEEGPSFESSMRAKYPIFHDRRDTMTGMAGR